MYVPACCEGVDGVDLVQRHAGIDGHVGLQGLVKLIIIIYQRTLVRL